MKTLRTLALMAVPAAALVQPPAKPAPKAAPAAAKAAPLSPVTLDSTLLRGYRWRNEAVVVDRLQSVQVIRHQPKQRRRVRASGPVDAARRRRRIGHARSGTEER